MVSDGFTFIITLSDGAATSAYARLAYEVDLPDAVNALRGSTLSYFKK